MSQPTPAEEVEALRAKCALLGASLRQAEAKVEALKAERNASPRLSDVLAPAFAHAQGAEINDALNWHGQLTGADLPWTDPGHDVAIERRRFSRIRGAAHGMAAVARLSLILRTAGNSGADADVSLLCGLDCALVALAEGIDERLASLTT